MTVSTLFKDRTYNDSDVQAVCDLLNACDAVDTTDDNYSVENLRTEFDDPEIDKARDLRLWEDEEGKLIGFGEVQLRKSEEDEVMDGRLYLRVHPDFREQGLEDTIVAWAFERAREAGREVNLPARVKAGARDNDTYGRAIWERHGMSVVRYFFTMVRDLSEPIAEPQLPTGFTLRHSTASSEDIQKWVDCFNLSFIDHWNHHPLTVESQMHWLNNSPDYEPARDLIAVADDGTVAAFCFCWIDKADNERNNRLVGWIDILGTRRGYRKMGLGRAMLLAGLRRLKGDGMTVARLGVDADNPTGALQLYEATGFTKLYTNVAYRLTLT